MATVKDLDTRLDDQEKSFIEFRSRADNIIAFGKWLAAFTAATVMSITFLAGSALYAAGKVSGTLEAQAKEIGKLSDRMDKQTERIDRLTQSIDELRAEIRKGRPANP